MNDENFQKSLKDINDLPLSQQLELIATATGDLLDTLYNRPMELALQALEGDPGFLYETLYESNRCQNQVGNLITKTLTHQLSAHLTGQGISIAVPELIDTNLPDDPWCGHAPRTTISWSYLFDPYDSSYLTNIKTIFNKEIDKRIKERGSAKTPL